VAQTKAAASVEVMKKMDTVKYGPSGCISTFLKPDSEENEDGEKGTCQVETKCKDIADDVFSEYPMGLVCVDKDQMPTRHLFGSNSFDKEEDFDTLIRCSTCLGLDKVSESVTLEATVKSLAKEVYEIKDEVYKLEKKADGTYASSSTETPAAEAPAAESPPAAEDASASTSFSLRGKKSEKVRDEDVYKAKDTTDEDAEDSSEEGSNEQQGDSSEEQESED